MLSFQLNSKVFEAVVSFRPHCLDSGFESVQVNCDSSPFILYCSKTN